MNQADARFCGHDRAVRVLLGHGLEWSTEFLRELIQLFQPRLFRVCGLFDFFLIQNADGASGTHHGQFDSGPDEELIGSHLSGTHRLFGAAVAFSQVHGDFRDRRFGIRIQHLRAMTDDAQALLLCSRQVAGNVDESDDRDIECVAEANEPGRFVGTIHIEASCQKHRLIGNKSHRSAVQPREAGHQIARPFRLQLEKIFAIDQPADDIAHIVGLLRIPRNEVFHIGDHSIRIVNGAGSRRSLKSTRRQIRKQLANLQQAVLVVGTDNIGNS